MERRMEVHDFLFQKIRPFLLPYVLGLLTALLLYLCLGGLCHDGGGVGSPQRELGKSETYTEEAAEGIERASARARGLGECIEAGERGVKRAYDRAGNIEKDSGEGEELLAECEDILRKVQERGRTGEGSS